MRFPFSCTWKPDFSSVFGGLVFLGCLPSSVLKRDLKPRKNVLWESSGLSVGRLQPCSPLQQDKLKQNISREYVSRPGSPTGETAQHRCSGSCGGTEGSEGSLDKMNSAVTSGDRS